MSPAAPTIYRATIFDTTGDALARPESEVFRAFADGALVVDARGRVVACGPHARMREAHPDAANVDLSGCVVIPAMVDGHIHYPQSAVMASYGEELLDWLERYIFPEEARYADPAYARARAALFFDELIAQGTGTALVFGAHFEEATAIAFGEAMRRRFRVVMGMTLADRHVPEPMRTTPQSATEASLRLIARFHGRDKCRYAVTPRFAPSCSEAMLEACRRLKDDHPGVLLQTHINENLREIEWCRSLFPGMRDYLDVYERAGLLGPRTVLAHDVHPGPRELETMGATDTRIVHCPDSNSFLGSGLFPLRSHIDRGIKVGLGTDVGAGASFSMFAAMAAAYRGQVLQIYGMSRSDGAMKLGGVRLLYLATLAGAQALGLDEECGSFLPGRCADFVVLDPSLDPFLKARLEVCRDPREVLFVLAMTADKHVIREVYLDGLPALHADQRPAPCREP